VTFGRILPMPCGCQAWRFGPTSGVRRCDEHFYEHHVRDFASPPCACLVCRAQRRGLSPFDTVAELMDMEQSGRPHGRAFDRTADLDVDRCGCLWYRLRPGVAARIGNTCPEHRSAEAVMRREAERARAEIAAMLPPRVPAAPLPWWRRLFARVRARLVRSSART
jgi:hypothetical protein